MTSPSKEVKELTAGRELDALVAEKVFGAFGFENIDVINGTPNELFAVLPGDRAVNRVPYFSTDIAAAWEVFLHLNRTRHLALELSGGDDEDSECHVTFIAHGYRSFQTERWTADARSVPEALCLAALKAVDSK